MININKKNINKKNDVVLVFGPTASGKSDFAIELSILLDGIIINADSTQIYKEAPILSNIPTKHQQKNIEHKLFAYLSIMEDSSLMKWLRLVENAVDVCRKSNKLPIIVGGSGLYINTILEGISPIPSNYECKIKAISTYENLGKDKFTELIRKIDNSFVMKFNDSQRLIRAYEVYLCSGKTITSFQKLPREKYINGNFINLFVHKDRELIYESIKDRSEKMIRRGVFKEAEQIFEITTHNQHLKKIIGLYEIYLMKNGKLTPQQTLELIQKHTRNYAKKQFTWFNNKIIDKISIDLSVRKNFVDTLKNMFNLTD